MPVLVLVLVTRYIPWPARPSGRSPWACFLSADLKTKPGRRGSLLFGEASEKPLTYAPVLLQAPMRPSPLVAPRKFSQTGGPAHASAAPRPTRTLKTLWMGSPLSPHPPKKSLTPPERFGSSPRPRISCPLRNWPSPAPRSKRTTPPVALPDALPVALPVLPPPSVIFSDPNAHEACLVLFMRRGRRRDIQAKMGC